MKNTTVIDSLERNIGTMFSFVGSIPNDQFLKEKVGKMFSIYDHVYKLSTIQEILYRRIEVFIREPEPVINAGNDNAVSVTHSCMDTPLHVLMRNFESWRKKQIELIRSADRTIWEKIGVCFDYERCTFEELVRQILLIDSFYMNQMQELRFLKEKIHA